MGHLIIGAGLGFGAFVLLLVQGAGLGPALAAYAGLGGAATFVLALVSEIAATRAAPLRPVRIGGTAAPL